jgi:RNA polymerase sigma-70 factor, ECF subfamily
MQLDDEHQIIKDSRRNPEAFGAIFDKYYPKILAYTIRRTGSVVAAEEIVSETFIKAFKNLSKFHWQGISIEAWLFRIAINEIRMYFRSQGTVTSLDEMYQREGFEPQADYNLAQELLEAQDRLERHEQFVRARHIIGNLPAKYQDVLLLRYIEKKKISEIAQILGKREGTVKSLLSRGLTRLRDALANESGAPKPSRIIKNKKRNQHE